MSSQSQNQRTTEKPIAVSAPGGKEHWKICILGDMGVGKTGLAEGFVRRTFDPDADPLRSRDEDLKPVEVTIQGHTTTLELFDPIDTDPSEPLVFSPGQGVQEANAYILLYSVRFRGSFDRLTSFHELIHAHQPPHWSPPFIVVGNMCDLDASDPDAREVPTEDGQRRADEWGCAFYETSVKENLHNVDRVFEELVLEARRKVNEANEAQKEDARGDDEVKKGCCGGGCVIM